ncbi:sensor histidine kinase [uncultured Fibrella sp.]|uniref:sensor histidine kinase n=1 Tax=uncultured Fibrella sp. TaxID=1284596 RepID=UPI0035CBA0F7
MSVWKTLFTSRPLLHVLFWLTWYGYGVYFTLIGISPAPPNYYGLLLLIHGVLAAVCYAHLYGLLPRLLRPGRYVYYGLSLAGLVGVGALPLTAIALALNNHQHGFGQTFSAELTNIALFLSITTFLHQYRQLQRNNQSLREKQVETELNLLKQQVNPHFFFNNLNSLYSLSLAQSPHTPVQILRLADLMRYMFDFAPQPQVALQKEIEYIQNYVALESMRLTDPTTVRLTVQGDPAGRVIAPMMLLPFVENAFKHGIEQQSRQGVVSIDVGIQANGLFLWVENTRPPVVLSQPELPGTGIANVRKRLNLTYPNQHTLHIDESPGHFRVSLHLTL